MSDRAASVLVVDDDVDTCRNLADILTDLGYSVDAVQDGEKALELVRKKHYDLALLDLRMPGMDGLTLYREIKKLSGGTVAVIVTAYASGNTMEEAGEAGVAHVLAKPVDLSKLLGIVERASEQPVVLVVDDDRDLCANLSDILREHDYRVFVAHGEMDATERLSRTNFHVVLIDMKLSQGDGCQVYNRVRQANPQARTVLITGYRSEMETMVERVMQEGADAACFKPFDIPQMLATLARLAPPSKRLASSQETGASS